MNRSGLLRVEEDEISFRHLLLQEFFAGRGIPSSDFMRTVLGKHWWMRAIIFYFGEKPGDEQALTALPSQLSEMKGTDLYQAAVSVGLSVQACYLTTTDVKLEVMEWVVHSMAITFDDVLNWFGKDKPSIDVFLVVFYYMYGRDAIAARIMSDFSDKVMAELERKTPDEVTEYDERRHFWCISGLIGIGDAKKAEQIVKKFHPKDRRLLLPIVLGCI